MGKPFTPGPYRVMKIQFAKRDWASLLGKDGIDVVVAGAGDVVAAVWSDDDSDEVAQANLFAAAPDAIHALELALEYWQHRQQRYKNRAPVWVQEARAAIAKAKDGEA